MEFTLRTIAVMILVLVGLLVLVTMTLGWGANVQKAFADIFEPFSRLLLGRPE